MQTRHNFAQILAGTLACVLAWIAPRCAAAADFTWIPPGDASFQSALSWSPNASAPPAAADQAIFDRYADGGEGVTDVTFSADVTNNRMIMRDDDIRLDLTGSPRGRTYRLLNSNMGTPGLVVAELGANISNLTIIGGTVETNYSTIAQATDTYGSVTVNAATWTTSQTLFVGRAGDADLFLETGAQVAAGRITIGDQADSDSIVSVEGEGALFRSAQQLVVGGAGEGELYVYEGIVRSTGAAIARDVDSRGVVSLLGGSWENTGNLDIGGGNASGGVGDLILDYGATVTTTGRTRVWENGLLSIRGGTLVTGSLENLGSLEYLVGVLHLTASDLTIGDSGVLGSVLALTPDMHTIVDQHTTIEADASISAIEGTFASGTMTNHGRLVIVDGGMQFTGTATNTATGRISVVDGTLATGTGATNRLTNQGKLDLLDAVVNGDLHNAAGTTITHGGAVAFNGRVTGDGQFSGGGHVTFNGHFEPGDAATALTFGGDIAFSTTNTLLMQLGGTTAGAQYDQINVVGSAAFAGTLDIALLGSFVPSAGQSFTLFEYDAHSGQFSVNPPPLSSGLNWSLDYGTNALVLSFLSPTTPGDLNADGLVDRADLALLVANLGMATGATTGQGDMNNDAKISLADVMMLRSHWSSPGSPTAAVPEPAAWCSAIVAISAIVLLRRRSM
jgi:T5SS/PEP-CTERM-associated repeat protein